MIYDASNARGAEVWDVDRVVKFDWVMSVDVAQGEVLIADQPLRAVDGEIAHHAVYFDSIHPIFAGEQSPCLFHCYGRKH